VELPTAKEADLPESVDGEVNSSVPTVLDKEATKGGCNRKYSTTFMAEDRAQIRKYAAENGNTAAVKKSLMRATVLEKSPLGFSNKNTWMSSRDAH